MKRTRRIIRIRKHDLDFIELFRSAFQLALYILDRITATDCRKVTMKFKKNPVKYDFRY